MQVEGNIATVASKTYRLTRPRHIQEEVITRSLALHQVVVEPVLASICHADLRYFTGRRSEEALAKKLPMALIHEGIGVIVESPSGKFKAGQRVAIVPNMPGYLLKGSEPDGCCIACRTGIGDNYCTEGSFLGSGVDGIAQERLIIPEDCAVPIPDDVPDEIAVLAELSSVSYHALRAVREKLGMAQTAIFGDGPVGYIMASLLHHVYGLQADRLHVFGAIEEKLNEFTFARRSLVMGYDFESAERKDIVIECTGGRFSRDAINQGIDILNPGGYLILMGVSEDLVPINTRGILEKGITVMGSSRSSTPDFQAVMAKLSSADYQSTLSTLFKHPFHEIFAENDLVTALDDANSTKDLSKVMLHFHW